MKNTFASEEDLVLATMHSPDFINEFERSGWEKWQAREVEGLFGIPDLFLAFGKIDSSGEKNVFSYAFEMKRKNWKRALTQAFRYAAFSNYSYVVLDSAYANPAVRNIGKFQRSNIGLITVDTNCKLDVCFHPNYAIPYSEHLYKDFYNTLDIYLFECEINTIACNQYYS